MAILAPPIVVFDLDGTLADTAGDLVATLNVILREEGLAPLPVEKARDMIGAGARALIERGFQSAGRTLTRATWSDFSTGSWSITGRTSASRRRCFRESKTLSTVSRRPDTFWRSAPTRSRTHSVKLLERLGVGHRFAFNAGRDTFPFFKPDARHLTQTIAEAGGDLRRAVMVGDSNTDIQTAKNARIPVIAVPFGYTETSVHDLGADRVIEHFDELFELVAALTCMAAA